MLLFSKEYEKIEIKEKRFAFLSPELAKVTAEKERIKQEIALAIEQKKLEIEKSKRLEAQRLEAVELNKKVEALKRLDLKKKSFESLQDIYKNANA